ncbi:helix-turn-helix domain-containing protein [Natronomonas gomsonensis]|uniref:helix-turn-helix domain-containing protein n=1 Tax=Natronomonas gomsonensis TaxID=1046043 RepID=UPI00227CAF33|nr:helix-turn-helix domain-containing protein [Natronomonas gomsonensis]MCY4732847.1 helix-turn-helix domain-containing protein [Natronomonas gomsonensis]
MGLEASFTVEDSEFPLNAVFEQLSSVTIELDRVVPTTTTAIPYFWIYTDDTTKLTTDLADDIGINQVTVIDQIKEAMLVRIDWNLDHESVLTAIINTDVTLLSGEGHGGQWVFKIRAQEQSEISTFQTYCRDHGLSIELAQLHSVSPLNDHQEYNLTADQRTALELAYNRGYFESPRRATQEDLGGDLDITRQAVSSLLKRGIRQLIASTLATTQPDQSPRTG